MGYIYLYYGTGGGKTTSALGLALRSVGHLHKVVIVQFMKWFKEAGEVKIEKMISPYYEIHQFGRQGWLRLGEEEKQIEIEGIQIREPEKKDREAAQQGLAFAESSLKSDEVDLIILDEICLAVYAGLLTVGSVLRLLDRIPKRTNVVLTGRYAPKELIEKADFVIKMIDEKSPKSFVTEKGIQY